MIRTKENIQLSSSAAIGYSSTNEHILDGQGVLILGADTLRDPEDDGGEHEGDVLGDVGIAVIGVLLRVVVQDVFEHKDSLRENRGVS